MFNIGAGEFLVILVVALVVLGPERLPGALRKAGQVISELRKMSAGFQDELREALDEPMRDLQGTVDIFRNPLGALADAAEAAQKQADAAAPAAAEGGFAPPSGAPVLMAPPEDSPAAPSPGDTPATEPPAAASEQAVAEPEAPRADDFVRPDESARAEAPLPPPPSPVPVPQVISTTEPDA